MIELLMDGIHLSFWWIMDHLLIINIILSILIIFFQRRNPTTVWTWLLVLYFIPGLGFILYLVLGQNFHKDRMFRMKEIEGQVKYAVRKQGESIYRRELRFRDPELDRYRQLMLYNLNACEAVLTDNNDIRIYTDGKEKFKALLWEMEHARSYIHLQYYIIKRDELWKQIEEVLIRKARQGVEVRVLFDSMGCRTMHNKDWERLEAEGIHVAEFFPAVLGKLQLRVNYRNHRKIAVIDGRIGFVGGFNIGREYLGRDPKFGYWRDTHLRFQGDAVDQMQMRFIMDWNFTAKFGLIHLGEKYFPKKEQQIKGVRTQIVSSGPDTQWKNIRNGYFKMINEAESNVFLTTPYFVPDDGIFEALRVAALSGLDVRIIIPGNPDHFFVYWASMSYLGELLEAGVRVYQYEKGFIHAKVLTIDGTVSSVGSANMDIRSFDLNFEVNAFMYDAGITKILEDDFLKDLHSSVEITKEWYRRRKWWFKVREAIARLISPML